MKHFSHGEHETFSVDCRCKLCFCLLTRGREGFWLRVRNPLPENNKVGGELKALNREEEAGSPRVGAFLSNPKQTVGVGGGDQGGAGDRESCPVTRAQAPEEQLLGLGTSAQQWPLQICGKCSSVIAWTLAAGRSCKMEGCKWWRNRT